MNIFLNICHHLCMFFLYLYLTPYPPLSVLLFKPLILFMDVFLACLYPPPPHPLMNKNHQSLSSVNTFCISNCASQTTGGLTYLSMVQIRMGSLASALRLCQPGSFLSHG